ncbi:NERD domain-containing protein [Phycicoccus sp. SLBN-51]|uniref:nuclease-related domain-containing DEAD/DEAH box helicase n=1 Tax=Phycicoccus sp. SLBN-51 TaxID=2768447 RepID=UPI00115414AA|nr:NERD domain-containing protein [Phycicoccus sp. SLBN-51]TQJ50222.1 AAA domain-containing protein [Phycicoccus sp. SLBN-51]
MGARALPEAPKFATESEREVWQRLVDQLRPEDVVLANVRLTDQRKDHEIDLVALLPGAGVVVLEVKGGSVWVKDGQWTQSRGPGTKRIDPVDQARSNLYALRQYVEADPRWRNSSRSRIRWGHTVVLPYSDVHDDFCLPDCPRWAVHGRDDQDDLAGRVWDIPTQQEGGHRVPDSDDVELIIEILRGRHLPAYDPASVADDREREADRLTAEQATLLKVTRLLNRVEVRGGAGSGKTVLALTQAKELTRGSHDRPAQRVALVCYSIGLAEYFKREVALAPRKHRPAFVGTFHELGRSWGAPDGSREDSAFWEHELPETMAALADELPAGQRFDSVIVDEAQDFADLWWRPLLRSLKDEETGGLYLYSDENQRIFARFGQPPVPLVPLVLDHNLRNTRQIAQSFGPLAPMRMTLRGGDGADVRFVATSADDAVGAADDEVEKLLGDGWQPQHVALITTGKRHPIQVERAEGTDQRDYWRSFWENDDVFYGHVLGCKGLERRAVVLCVNQGEVTDRSRERLYVGMSRATDVLVVVGDPAVVREMGGDQVAARLGL